MNETEFTAANARSLLNKHFSAQVGEVVLVETAIAAVMDAFRLGAESAALNVNRALREEIEIQMGGCGLASTSSLIREIQRVYAENKKLRSDLTDTFAAGQTAANRADEAEREVKRLREEHEAMRKDMVAALTKVDDLSAQLPSPKPAPELKLTDVNGGAKLMTRSGKPARFLTELANSDDPLAFAIKWNDGEETLVSRKRDGRSLDGCDSSDDIVNVPDEPRRVRVEVRIYDGGPEHGAWSMSRTEDEQQPWPDSPAVASKIFMLDISE